MKLSSLLLTAFSSTIILALTALPSAQVAGQAADPPKAKSTLILEQELEGLPGYVVQVVLIEGPPGWVGGRHYHPGHVVGYILEGSYEFNFDDVTSRTVGAGEAFYESPNTVMRSKNGSSTEWVRDVVFHLKRKEDPPAVSVQDD